MFWLVRIVKRWNFYNTVHLNQNELKKEMVEISSIIPFVSYISGWVRKVEQKINLDQSSNGAHVDESQHMFYIVVDENQAGQNS